MTAPRERESEIRAEVPGVQQAAGVARWQELTEQLAQLKPEPRLDEGWQEAKALVPMDLETSARDNKALERRREVRSGEDLLRLALLYSHCDWSLRITAAWACLNGWANLSANGLRKRLQGARVWLGVLVAACVIKTQLDLGSPPVRLRLIDATAVSGLHSKGTDWRLHLSYDLGRGGFDGVEVTDSHGGETLVRHPAQPGDIQVADRGYCHRRGIGRVLSQGGDLVVRICLQNLPVADEGGQGLDLLPWLRQAPVTEPIERQVQIDTPDGRFSVRLIALRLNQQAAEAARRRMAEQARKKGRTPDQRSLEAAGFITVVSTLDSQLWGAAQVLALYRLRWQVELAIKRLKSVLQLDHLRAQDPDLSQSYLLAKLLGALMIDRLSHPGITVTIDWFDSLERPVSPWRWLVIFAEVLRQAARGAILLSDLLRALPKLRRYLCDTPRRRRQHHTIGRRLVQTLIGLAAQSSGHPVYATPLLLP